MSKKVIGIIVVAVLLIVVTVGIIAIRLSKEDVSAGKTEINLKLVNFQTLIFLLTIVLANAKILL